VKMKKCLKAPVDEIFIASKLLEDAVDAHINEDYKNAALLFKKADMPEIRFWTESIWGIGGIYSNLKKNLGEPKTLPKELRAQIRMPNKKMEKEIIARDGYCCKFCGIPVIRKEIRVQLNKHYPNEIKWGKTNSEQHAAFQAMWLQFDHIIPHARGGQTNIDNVVITCAPCNYGRMNFLLEEIGIAHLDFNKKSPIEWDGLERKLTLID